MSCRVGSDELQQLCPPGSALLGVLTNIRYGDKVPLLESSPVNVPRVLFMGHRFHSRMAVPPHCVSDTHTHTAQVIDYCSSDPFWRDLTADHLKASVSNKQWQTLRAGCKAVVQKLFELTRFHGDESLISLK